MADDEQAAPGAAPRSAQEYVGQLRAAAERLQDLAQSGGHVLSASGALVRPGALSAAQMASITDGIAAQRRSIEALQAQLSSFDEQLAALEQILDPLAQWSRTWADLERQLFSLGPGPDTGGG